MGKSYVLDASIFDDHNTVEAVREDVAMNRIVFEFPAGFSDIDFIEECRALNALYDFDLMYDITMQMLAEKPVIIYLRKYSDSNEKVELAKFIVTNRYMDLRGVDILHKYPVIVNWLVKMIGEHLLKKFPRPSVDGLAESLEQKGPANTSTKKGKKSQKKSATEAQSSSKTL